MQHNIACILHISSSNKMFCSIHDFTFLMTETKIKGQVSLSFVFVMLPAQLIALANWFAWVPACTSAITWVSLRSLIIGIRTETRQRINVVHCGRGIYLSVFFLYLIIKFCLCKRQDMSKNSNISQLLQHFWINFWSLVFFTY